MIKSSEIAHWIDLSVMLIDPVFKMGENYHPQVFSGESTYIAKEEELGRNITEDLEISFDGG